MRKTEFGCYVQRTVFINLDVKFVLCAKNNVY